MRQKGASRARICAVARFIGMRTARSARIGALAVFLVVGCARHATKPPTSVHVEPEHATYDTRSAPEIVREIVGGRATILLDVSALREHRFAEGLTRMGGLQKTFDLAGVDAMWEVDAAFVAVASMTSCRTGFVIRHRMSAERSREALARAVSDADAGGAWVDGLGFPAIEVTIGKQRRLVAEPLRDHWIVLPADEAPRAADLAGAGGLVHAFEGRAWTIRATRRAWSNTELSAAPTSIDGGVGSIVLDNDGAHAIVDLHDVGDDPGLDARDIDDGIRAAGGLSFLGVHIMPLRPRWTAIGSTVRGTLDVGPVMLEALLALPFDTC
jgi:hypothetical protein